MSDKPQFAGIYESSPDSFVPIVTIKSDGKDFLCDFPEAIIPYINQRCIDHALDALKDAFYRVRPDLRKQ